jgi:putative NADH-flavin reductase
MKLVILGATGKTGRVLVQQAVQRGHTVTAVVRNLDKLAATPGVKVIKGDVTRADELTKIFKGQDAVLSTLGNNNAKLQLIEHSSAAIIKAMQATGLKRVVAELSFAGAESVQLNKVLGVVANLGIGKMLVDQTKGVELFRRSKLDWTIAYAVILTNKPLTKEVRVLDPHEVIGMRHKISRADVAHFMLDSVEKGAHINGLPVISN